MMRRYAQLVLVLALVLSVGGHWAVLQSVAWVSMAFHFARTDPLLVALEKTFDGTHPCDLCKVVQQAKDSKRQPDAAKAKGRLDLCTFERPAFLQCPLPHLQPSLPLHSWPGRTDPPLLPPPRAA